MTPAERADMRRSGAAEGRVCDDAPVAHRLEDVYDELAPVVVGYLRGHGSRDPEGLCGDVFVRAAAGLPTFRGDRAALRRWVFTIAHHRLVDELRSAARHREQPAAEPPERQGEDARHDLDVDLDVDLLAALAQLTDDQRSVVVLRYVADLPIRDVATILGKRPGAVKMLQARGLAELRARLDDPADVP